MKCGHHQSLAINSAETGEFLYCDLCDAKSRCRDAEAMEAELRAALAAQPAEPLFVAAPPVQRLSDERAAFEAWHNEYRTQELVRCDDTYYNTHVRCRWEGWQARAIESALQTKATK